MLGVSQKSGLKQKGLIDMIKKTVILLFSHYKFSSGSDDRLDPVWHGQNQVSEGTCLDSWPSCLKWFFYRGQIVWSLLLRFELFFENWPKIFYLVEVRFVGRPNSFLHDLYFMTFKPISGGLSCMTWWIVLLENGVTHWINQLPLINFACRSGSGVHRKPIILEYPSMVVLSIYRGLVWNNMQFCKAFCWHSTPHPELPRELVSFMILTFSWTVCSNSVILVFWVCIQLKGALIAKNYLWPFCQCQILIVFAEF